MKSASKRVSPSKAAKEEFIEYPPLLRDLLIKRGIATREDAEVFMAPNYDRDVYDPFLIKGMEKAVSRILAGIRAQERIIIYSDYDADGIPGGVILHDFFQKIGYENFGNYIPDRHTEGYGLNHEALTSFKKDNATLIITVDCGIADVEEVAFAQDNGMDVIVTDHHLPQEVLPKAFVILNSKQEDDTYPFKELAGAGVAYKLVQALVEKGREEKLFDVPVGWEKWLLDMAGIATISDMVPLKGENRALAHFGLHVLRKSRRPGLKKLLSKLKINQRDITEDDISFMVAPRINAASRMDVPFEAFRLFATQNDDLAAELADHLHHINDMRKGLVASIVKEARKTLGKREEKNIIVIGDPNWRPGILGLVATRLVEDFKKPAFVWGGGESGHLKGSCRSDGTVNVVELMTQVSAGTFVDVGGHEFSGGFSVSRERVHFLEEELIRVYDSVKKSTSHTPLYNIDAELPVSAVTWDTYASIEKLAPFGVGNPKPVFMFRDVTVESVAFFGKERNHVRLKVSSGNARSDAIGFFFQKELFPEVSFEKGARIHLVGSIEKSTFGSRRELRLRIVDVLPN